MTKQEALEQLVVASRHLVRLTTQEPWMRAATVVLEQRALERLQEAVATYDQAEARARVYTKNRKRTQGVRNGEQQEETT